MNLVQYNPPHPGELIERTYIEPFPEITAASVSRALGVSKSTFSRLLNGKSDVSPEMALRLSAVLGRSAESWLALQDNYDLCKARKTVNTNNLNRLSYQFT
ncbi:MAG: HigA family addiction module antitoxin [Cellvibrionaceae bacterium]|nr:HigA family addiction module antitoxin [Cellvibrionaceae bacterium]